MHAICLCTSSLHFSSASDASALKKQSSLADFVSGHAQHLPSAPVLVSFRLKQELCAKMNVRFQTLGIERVLFRVCGVIRLVLNRGGGRAGASQP